MFRKSLAALLLLVSAVAVADMEKAQLAFKKGDHEGAIKEFTALGNAGNISAQLMLGALYSKGGVIPRDEKAAIEWFQKAASQGNTDAQYLLGNLYENSQLPQHYSQAATWYHKAAQKGSDKAEVRLGHFYTNGSGVTQNYNEAILWYGKAALQGNAEAQFCLGRMYTFGKGLAKNDQLAIGWLTKAAAQNYVDAQLLLGIIYHKGADKKLVLAHALYGLALIHDPKRADLPGLRDNLAKEMSPEQLEYSSQLIVELQKPNNFSRAMANYLEKSDQMFRFFKRPEK